jgi:hypothetical protein
MVATIDESGAILLAPFPSPASPWDPSPLTGSPGMGDGEFGWGGVAFDSLGAYLSVARTWQRSVAVYDLSTR